MNSTYTLFNLIEQIPIHFNRLIMRLNKFAPIQIFEQDSYLDFTAYQALICRQDYPIQSEQVPYPHACYQLFMNETPYSTKI